MKEKKIEGIGIFSENGFTFDSGMPTDEPVIDFGVGRHHGTLKVEQNACATFAEDPLRVIMPPTIDEVLRDHNLTVKRTTRNFIVTMKFPIIEATDTTAQTHREMWNKVKKAVSGAREDIKKQF